MNKKKVIKFVVSLVFLLGLLCCILSVFSFETEHKVASINEFLNGNYCFFLVMRLVIYCFVGFVLFKFKITIKAKVKTEKQNDYNKLFFRTSIICVVLICFNETMLFMHLMG
ncbi:hypothetical protein [Gilliamella sp. Pas-s25]|uniref:hypothetical protein n=1 Tax=Gilliamella sp. Pas-s25 TaxID=2687310 RepID=UPI00135D6315|nr:hypothetical protein [Gilliamella sp. Pas-s25]MWP61589.1 hypothetical protein [Gilliamella sp. Pas-s25]